MLFIFVEEHSDMIKLLNLFNEKGLTAQRIALMTQDMQFEYRNSTNNTEDEMVDLVNTAMNFGYCAHVRHSNPNYKTIFKAFHNEIPFHADHLGRTSDS